MPEILTEKCLSLAEAARRCPGPRPNICTVWRWTKKGARGVVLESAWRGGRIVISEEALQRFFDRLNAAPAPAVTPIPTSRTRARQVDRARRKLAAAGV